VKRLDRALSDAPAMLLAGRGDVDRRFLIKSLGRQGKLQWLELTPKQDAGEFSRVRIGFEGDTIRSLELTDQFGQITRITLENNEINADVADTVFDFHVPENVDVFEADE